VTYSEIYLRAWVYPVTKMKVSVFIPAHNEEESIAEVIQGVKKHVKGDIFVVNDGSTDNTSKIAKKSGAKVIDVPSQGGLANAFRVGLSEILKGKPDIILQTDADGQYNSEFIPKLLEPVQKGEADLVLGSRFMGTIESMPFMKKFGNRMFSRVISKIAGVKVTDGQTGFRAFNTRAAEAMEVISDFTYTQETIIRVAKKNLRVKDVPVYFAKRKHGKSKLMHGPFEYAAKAGINMMRVYRDYRPLRFFGSIGGFFSIIGFLFGIYLIQQYFARADLDELVPTIMLTVLFLVVGLQIILFGFLADMNRK